MTIQDKLKEILERTEKAATARSDDFGHDCQALLVIAGTDVPALTKALTVAGVALEDYASFGGLEAEQALKEINRILNA